MKSLQQTNELILLSKNDIPFLEAQVNIHQPTISEISFIGEENFFTGCQFLNFSKSSIPKQDRIGLEDKSDFEVLMSIFNSGPQGLKYQNCALMVLTLLFPDAEIKITNNEILLVIKKQNNISRINTFNYEQFRDIVVSMFCLNDTDGSGQSKGYNPKGKRAEKIAAKFQKAKNKRNQNKEATKVAMFSRYISILAVGESKDLNDLLNYTVYQLKDEFKRYQKKNEYDIYIQAKMAGAKDLDDVDNWMDDIHP